MRRQIEAGVHGSERPRGLALVDDQRDVALRRPLGDRADVDAGAAERAEHFRGHARRARHRVTDDGQDAAVANDVHVLDLTEPELPFERRADDLLGALRLGLRHGETDRMLRAALRDQDHGDAVLAQRAEYALRRAGHTDHPGAFDVDERSLIDAGYSLYRVRRHRPGTNERPRP